MFIYGSLVRERTLTQNRQDSVRFVFRVGQDPVRFMSDRMLSVCAKLNKKDGILSVFCPFITPGDVRCVNPPPPIGAGNGFVRVSGRASGGK